MANVQLLSTRVSIKLNARSSNMDEKIFFWIIISLRSPMKVKFSYDSVMQNVSTLERRTYALRKFHVNCLNYIPNYVYTIYAM